ncbi:RNA polymerase sigma-70 factor [Fulvivirgaceae bacterium BMA12]|uniref:RNA polymerase sigma factor n=1 Tax=Agaribacillus aureus TaxID=3051825 RepID=A0ABT8LHT4_9BACT|nr:RNA polymerase sigma-70 factor [Fulvivirgaceae bacterium BMA12]
MRKTNLPDDHDLLKAIRYGQKKAFNILFDRYASQLHHVALKYTGSPDKAEDIVQETFVKVWTHREKLQPHLPFVPYIIRISKNLIINRAKKRLHEQAYLRYKSLVHQDIGDTTENHVFLKELKDLLETKVAQLPEKRKKIYQMSREQGLTNREIAKKLVVSESTVENHINKALKDLKNYLQTYKYLSWIPQLILIRIVLVG